MKEKKGKMFFKIEPNQTCENLAFGAVRKCVSVDFENAANSLHVQKSAATQPIASRPKFVTEASLVTITTT